MTIAPYVIKDEVLVGSSGAELGVRGYVTAYDVHDGTQKWRAYETGPDDEMKLGTDFNSHNPQYGRFGLGTSKTWQENTWKIGGGTNWGWYAYDPGTNLVYYGSGNPSPWNATMRPGDNKWTMTIFGRDVDTGEAKFGYQKTPHDEWDYAGVDVMILSDEKDDNGNIHKLLFHPDRNGFIYSLDRTNGDLFTVGKIDATMNEFKDVNFKNGQPIRDPEYATYMDHEAHDVCPSAMGYHDQAHDSYDPTSSSSTSTRTISAWTGSPSCFPIVPVSSSSARPCTCIRVRRAIVQNALGLGQVKAYDAVHKSFKWQVQERFAAWGWLAFHGRQSGLLRNARRLYQSA